MTGGVFYELKFRIVVTILLIEIQNSSDYTIN